MNCILSADCLVLIFLADAALHGNSSSDYSQLCLYPADLLKAYIAYRIRIDSYKMSYIVYCHESEWHARGDFLSQSSMVMEKSVTKNNNTEISFLERAGFKLPLNEQGVGGTIFSAQMKMTAYFASFAASKR